MKVNSLPDYLKSVLAFESGERIAEELRRTSSSSKETAEAIGKFLGDPDAIIVLLVCELVADSIGHPCWSCCWNVYVCRWLFETEFVADLQLQRTAEKSVRSLLRFGDIQESWHYQLQALAVRLAANRIQRKRLNPILRKEEYDRISIGLAGNHEAFGLERECLAIYNPTFERALEATFLDEGCVSELFVNFVGEPTREDQLSIGFLLYRFRKSLKRIRCDAQKGEGSNISELSFSFWRELVPLVLKAVDLESFESTDLAIEEEYAVRVIQLPRMMIFRFSTFSIEVLSFSRFGRRLVEAAIENKSLLVLSIPELDQHLLTELEASTSRPMIQINGKRVLEKKRD